MGLRQVCVGVVALALAMWLANRVYRATLASRATNDPETGGWKDVLAGSAAQEEEPGADRSGSTNGAAFDEPDYTIRGLLHTSMFALLAGVLAGAPLGIHPQCFLNPVALFDSYLTAALPAD